MGIEGIWGKDRGKHGVKVDGSKSEDRWKQGQDREKQKWEYMETKARIEGSRGRK